MDLSLDDEQQAIVDLAAQILGDACTPEHCKHIERTTGEDADLHADLVAADLIGLSLPESAGGGGYGLLEAALLADTVGAHTAPIPVVDVVAAGRALGRAGHAGAAGVAAGDIVRPALREGPDACETMLPSTTAEAVGTGWAITGTKALVGGPLVDAYLVSASDTDGTVALFLVAAAEGTRTESTSSTGAPVAWVDFERAPADRLDGDGSRELARLRDELQVLRCATQAGVVRGALAIAAAYCSEREQFQSKIGTFQAVAHRLADGWIDANAIEMTSRQAAWRLDVGLPADQAIASACFWATDGAHRVVHAAQHVHGGIGVDTDYPVHRYFRWAKSLEVALGSGSRALDVLGDAIADEPLSIG